MLETLATPWMTRMSPGSAESFQDFLRQPRQFHQAEGFGRELSERAFRHTID
jgi:hypothetical protein